MTNIPSKNGVLFEYCNRCAEFLEEGHEHESRPQPKPEIAHIYDIKDPDEYARTAKDIYLKLSAKYKGVKA